VSAARPLTAERLVIASHNEGKVAEFRALLEPLGIEALSAASLDLDEPEETGESFRANAEIKARRAAAGSALPALADDSGLVVPALEGAPGIRSARWAGPGKDFRRAMKRIEDALRERGCAPEGAPACFVAALSLCWPDGHCESFEGRVDGRLTFPPRGEKGFGYDPIFIPEGSTITFGEMKPEKKHAISHRARAFERMIAAGFAGSKAGGP